MKNDGKDLEDEAQKEFNKNVDPNFHWRRLYDTFTAKRGMPPQPADFFLSELGTGSAHLECKTSEHKGCRLRTFSQLGDMLRWQQAGVAGFVLCHFYVPNELLLFDIKNIDPLLPSWVVTEVKDVVKLKRIELLPEAVRAMMRGH